MAKIEHIKNKRGEVIYPVSKEGAIYDENGVLLSTKIATFITRLVDNLANYYLKSETYTKGEVDNLIGAIQGFTYIVVSELPTASAETMGIVYLVPSEDPQTQNVKDEYITIRSGVEGSYTYSWEQIGSTAIDLSGYVTTEALNTALADYTTTANLTTLLAAKQDTIADLSTIRSGAAAGATAYQKPGTGIPATDMASGVQTSLGKADSAYQKPSGGIPKTDLESSVQGSLELADTAVQADPIGSIVPPVDPSEFATKEEVEGLEAKVDDLGEDVNGVSAFDESVEIQTTAGTAISQSAVHPLSIISGREYVVNFISGWSNANYVKVYFADAEGTILTSTFKTMDGANSDNHFTSEVPQKKVIVSGDATSIRFYTSGTNVIGTGTIVCEVSAPAIDGIIQVLNTLQDDVNAEKITISKNYTFEGAGNTIVRKEIKLIAGRIYAIWFSDPEWNDSTITAGNNKFFVDKVVGGVSSGVFGYTKGATVPKEAIMTAETADYYILGFRGDVGESVDICVSDISEVKPSVDSLEYSRNVSIISASGWIVNIDTKTKTLSFGNDCVVFIGEKRFAIVNDPDAMAVSYASVNSSAIKLLFNTNTQKFRFVVYSSTAFASGEILVGAMRVYRNKIINCSFPFDYTIDGWGRYEPTITFVGVNRSQFMRNVNHQGYNDIAPNNTLPAFRLSRQFGFDYAETDVRFTSDGYPVLLHDATVDATSDGTGDIADMTLSQARALDFGSWKNAQYAGTQIPTYEEFLTLCKKIQLRPYIELKAGTEAQIKGLAETVVRYGLEDVATFICTVPDWLGYVKDISPKIRLGYLEYQDIDDDTISTVQSLQSGENEVFIDSQYSALTSSGIAKAATARIPVEVWTLATVSTINGLDPYISGVTSNQRVASQENYRANIGDAWGL